MKNDEHSKRQSGYNSNRRSFLSSDGRYYCYVFYDSVTKKDVTTRLEVGVDITFETAAFLDKSDHEYDLLERYENEHRDPLFDFNVRRRGKNDDDDDLPDPWDKVPDRRGDPENAMFSEDEPVDPLIAAVDEVIDNLLTENQRDLYYEHFGMCLTLEEIRQAEIRDTGKTISPAAMTNRKNKIIRKVAKSLGEEPVKRRRTPKDDD